MTLFGTGHTRRHVYNKTFDDYQIHPIGKTMKPNKPLTEFLDQADEIVGESDDIGELNALRNFDLMGRVFQDFERAFTAVTQLNGQAHG